MRPAASAVSPAALVAAIAVVVGAFYLGRDILIPLALAILLSFMLAPIVIRLRRWGLGRIPSVLAVVLLLSVALLGLGSIVASQVVHLADNLPRYEWNLRTKIRDLRIAVPSGGVVERTSDMLRDLSKEMEKATAPPEGKDKGAEEAAAPEPVLVQIQQPEASPIQTLREVGGPLVAPVATAGLVVVFVIFMLLQREDLRDRVLRLVGASDVARATEAMNDAAKRISRYLLMQLVINVLYGIPIGIGLYFIGVPNPILWGLLHSLHRAGARGAIPHRPVVRGRPGVDAAATDHRAVREPGAAQQQRARAMAVRLEHRAFPGRGPRGRGRLDHAVGAGRAAAVDPAYGLLGGARAPCSPARFLRRAAGR
jgi:predicted PurR-regulated permease PerM